MIETPTLRQDGSILQKPGYDPSSRLLFQPGENIFPAIPQEPTKEQAKKALSEIFGLLDEFPFVEEADKSVAVAALLTAIVRRSLPSSPLFAISSPAPGTGKSELIDMISRIATGHPSSVSSQGTNEEEMEKRLGTSLLEGNAIINIDNIERPLKGQVLCQMLTQQMVKIRILGQSKSRDLPSIATIFANGNNLLLSGDLNRRSLLCRLDAKTERPEERIFKRNLTDYIYTNRGEIVKAVLTILRAYHVSGKPDLELKPFGSFEI